jgi:hypothetical protein
MTMAFDLGILRIWPDIAGVCEFRVMRTLALTLFDRGANVRIMRTTQFHLTALKKFLDKHKVATMAQISTALGGPARCTVFRKLAELDAMNSYSHRGKYYTLRAIARFSARGLWHFRSVWFSRFGNLLETAEAFVQRSSAGYSAKELRETLGVKTKHALAQLVRNGRLQREKIGASYIYFSRENNTARRQRTARKAHAGTPRASLIVTNPDLAVQEAKATLLLFSSMLNEKQRRLYAGLESLKLGHGGDAHIAAILDMDPHTVARGREELMRADCDNDKVRASGGGRLSQEKKRPE